MTRISSNSLLKEREILKNTVEGLGLNLNQSTVINRGNNSICYKSASIDGSRFFLKIFRDDIEGVTERLSREVSFMNMLDKSGFNGCSDLISYNTSERWLITSFIEGDQIEVIDDCTIKAAIDFQRFLGSEVVQASSHDIGFASEAFVYVDVFYASVRNAIDKLNKSLIELPTRETIVAVLNNELDSALSCSAKIEERSRMCIEKGARWLSPSDVGIHNMIRSTQRYYFIDFEHAGWDQPIKWALDWILRPGSMLNDAALTNRFLDLLSCEGVELNNRDLYHIGMVYRLKWAALLVRHASRMSSHITAECILGKFLHYMDTSRKCLEELRGV